MAHGFAVTGSHELALPCGKGGNYTRMVATQQSYVRNLVWKVEGWPAEGTRVLEMTLYFC